MKSTTTLHLKPLNLVKCRADIVNWFWDGRQPHNNETLNYNSFSTLGS